MCVVGVAHLASSRYPLIVAANRDELHARPTAPADWWEGSDEILGGRDLLAGGTWLGISRSGRFAAVTNIYEPDAVALDAELSRGQLVTNFLGAKTSPADYASALVTDGARYGPFKLIVTNGKAMSFASNRMAHASLDRGVHVFTSGPPGQVSARADAVAESIRAALDRREIEPFLLDVLTGERARGPADRAMDSMFVVGKTFGTRSATVLTVAADGNASFLEHRFAPDGEPAGCSRFTFTVTPMRD